MIADEAGCTSASGEWIGPGTTCQGQPGNPITCCPANFNQADGVTVQDLFDYLDAWFTLAPTADLNGDTNVTVQDLFDYLDLWFAGSASADVNGQNGVSVQDIFDFLARWFATC